MGGVWHEGETVGWEEWGGERMWWGGSTVRGRGGFGSGR